MVDFPDCEYFEAVTFRNILGFSANGPVYGLSKTAKCHLEFEQKTVEDQRGMSFVCGMWGVFAPNHGLTVGDKVEFENKLYEIKRISMFRFEGRPHHCEIFFEELAQ